MSSENTKLRIGPVGQLGSQDKTAVP